MKKIRMIITGAFVFAIVGSALAFKAYNPRNIFCNDDNGKCTTAVDFTSINTGVGATTDPCGEGSGVDHHYATTSSTSTGCAVATFTVYTPNQQ